MARRQAVQHKATRDDRRSKEFNDYKRENTQLKRQLSRLRKELEQVKVNIPEPECVPLLTPPAVPIAVTCGTCSSQQLKSLNLPSGVVFSVCLNCGAKHRSPPPKVAAELKTS